MNDELTKDELQIILLEMNTTINKTKAAGLLKVADSYIDLRDKIQSMIDDYCEHEWNETGSEREYFRCAKCGEEA